MSINRSNYETYIIDYLEGRLDDRLLEELMKFLEANPDISEEFSGMEDMPRLNESMEHFPRRSELHLNEVGLPALNVKTFDIWLAAAMEGDLTDSMQAELQAFVGSDSERMKQAEQMKKARLPMAAELFEDKSILKRTVTPIDIHAGNISDWLLAKMEGQTSELENEAISTFLIANPQYQRDIELLERTRLQADPSIIYPGKSSLRRFIIPAVTEQTASRVLSIAASIVIVLGFSWFGFFTDRNEVIRLQMAQTHYQSAQPPRVSTVDDANFMGEDEPRVSQVIRDNRPSLAAVETPMLTSLSLQPDGSAPSELSLRFSRHPHIIYSDASEALNAPGAITLQQLGALRLRQFAYGKGETNNTDPKLSKWELADAGIAGINKLTGSNLRFERQFGPEGKLESYYVGNDRFYLARQ